MRFFVKSVDEVAFTQRLKHNKITKNRWKRMQKEGNNMGATNEKKPTPKQQTNKSKQTTKQKPHTQKKKLSS